MPTCLRKLFEEGPRHKCVDIVTDTLHASSSDLITWNTLAMLKNDRVKEIKLEWFQVAAASLPVWDKGIFSSPLALIPGEGVRESSLWP